MFEEISEGNELMIIGDFNPRIGTQDEMVEEIDDELIKIQENPKTKLNDNG